MSPSLPLRRRHDDEPTALHAAMAAAAGGDPAAMGAALAALSGARIWVAVASGLEGGAGRAAARAEISGGHTLLGVRVGQLADGTPFLAAATTAARLEASRLTEPGDTLTAMPLASLARVALGNGLATVVVNPGTVPLAHLAAGALRSIADGAQPDGGDPDRRATARADRLRERDAAVPDDLATAIAEILSAEPVEVAAIEPREIGGSPVWVCLVPGSVPPEVEASLVAAAAPLIGPEAYFAVESVRTDDRRLTSPSRGRVVVDRRPPA